MSHALIFPGQGSQSKGMMADLASNFAVVGKTFDEANEILGFDLWKLIQNDEVALDQTKNTQVAMLVSGFATYLVLKSETNLSPICMAGHSLGEWSAMVASGYLSFTDGVKLVRKRAELMQNAVPLGEGAMAAILGLDDDMVRQVCAHYPGKGVVQAVNFNAPGQVVISGNKKAVKQACEALKNAGAKRAVLLSISVPAHCSLMREAADNFIRDVNDTNFENGKVTVLHNIDAKKSDDIDHLKAHLIAQIFLPVQWSKIIKTMQELGAKCFIESAPGKILSGLNRRIDKSIIALDTVDTNSIKIISKELK